VAENKIFRIKPDSSPGMKGNLF